MIPCQGNLSIQDMFDKFHVQGIRIFCFLKREVGGGSKLQVASAGSGFGAARHAQGDFLRGFGKGELWETTLFGA